MTIAELRALLTLLHLPLAADLDIYDEETHEIVAGVSDRYVNVLFLSATEHVHGVAGAWDAAKQSKEYTQADAIAKALNAMLALLDVAEAAKRTLSEHIPSNHRLRCDCAECALDAALAKLETP